MAYVADGLGFIGKRLERPRGRLKEVSLEDIAKDTGCKDVSPSCLSCPLPACIYDVPGAQRAEFLAKFLPQTARRA
jgi:hypothetical protein